MSKISKTIDAELIRIDEEIKALRARQAKLATKPEQINFLLNEYARLKSDSVKEEIIKMMEA